MLSAFALASSLLAAGCYACDPGHGSKLHAKRQLSNFTTTAFPSRELIWNDVNFLATTDSHGWLAGHQKSSEPEPNYAGDAGDFYSFVQAMKAMAVEKDVDLLLIDSGDLHDGNGLSDATRNGEVNGALSGLIFQQLPYDVLAIGNHELYIYEVTKDVHDNFAPGWNGRYLSSNANITIPGSDGKNVSIPVGSSNTADSRFAKFETRKGKKVTAFGILYDFQGGSSGVNVTAPAKMVNETWFLEAIEERPDFFVLAGHMAVKGSGSDFKLALRKIRAIHPTTPVFIFGGHTHIRDCVQEDPYSMSLESGRYMETVGFLSSNLPDSTNATEPLDAQRRYIDANRNAYAFHTKTQGDLVDTDVGLNITAQMQNLVQLLNLSAVLGTAPKDYYLDRVPYGSNDSMLTLLTNEVLPSVIADETRANKSKIVIVNSGSQRFDIYKGDFDVNDNFIVSPFTNSFRYVELPFRIASKILPGLNRYRDYKRELIEKEEDPFKRSQRIAWENHVRRQAELESLAPEKRDMFEAKGNFSLGYVTNDTCPGEGDDTIHSPIPYAGDAPTYLSTPLPTGLGDDDLVDVVYLDFFASYIFPLVAALDPTINITASDAKIYGPPENSTDPRAFRTDRMWGEYAAKFWS